MPDDCQHKQGQRGHRPAQNHGDVPQLYRMLAGNLEARLMGEVVFRDVRPFEQPDLANHPKAGRGLGR